MQALSNISLVMLSLSQLRELAENRFSPDGISIEDGALPPGFLLAPAIDAMKQGKPPIWFSLFLFIETHSKRIVGNAGFKGAPVNGRVEIGYGVAESACGRGIATEAVRQLVELALKEEGVIEILAETSIDNIASRRVVEKNGFHHIGQRDTEEDGIVDRWLITR